MSRSRLVPVLVASLLMAGVTSTAVAQSDKEYQVKGAFIYNMLNFVEWPAGALPTDGTLRIAVVSNSPIPELSAVFAGRNVKGRPLVVKVYSHSEQLGPCDVLFIAADAAPQLRNVLKLVDAQPVLTIAEQDLSAPSAAVITLGIVQARIAFGVNLDAADTVGVQLNANLLKLAKSVKSARGHTSGS